jgi:hypothetical protein
MLTYLFGVLDWRMALTSGPNDIRRLVRDSPSVFREDRATKTVSVEYIVGGPLVPADHSCSQCDGDNHRSDADELAVAASRQWAFSSEHTTQHRKCDLVARASISKQS